jgi:membrane protein implicated in regulation of membrane protease activity
MENLLSAAVIWFIIGFILFILEFVVPGLILFFFGLGAWIVAIVSLFYNVSLNEQMIIFVISSVVSIVLLRKWLSKIIWERKHSTELLEDEFIGKTAVAETQIRPGENGKIAFKGTSWQAASADIISKGENVIIIGNESILLIVKSTKNL